MNSKWLQFYSKIQIGCGLIAIGRAWGVGSSEIPSDMEVRTFLEGAYNLGIRVFDTAPAYGLSEQRLGAFLKSLTVEERKDLIITTKAGEYWDNKTNDTRVDHSYAAMTHSIESSLAILGQIDLLQLHKTSLSVLQSAELNQAWEYARQHGIEAFGASITDIESAKWTCEHDEYLAIQFPFNAANNSFHEVFDTANKHHKIILVNRPFNMGKMTQMSTWNPVSAYKAILQNKFEGVILTGTKSLLHLQLNIEAFNTAVQELSGIQQI